MIIQGVQDVSIEDIIQRYELWAITYREYIIKYPILQSINGKQPTMEVVVISHTCNRLFNCHQHYSIMDYKEIFLMHRPFHQFLSFLHHDPYQISDTEEFSYGGGRL